MGDLPAFPPTRTLPLHVPSANCGITDTVGAMIGACLRRYGSVRLLILDSNNITGDAIVSLIRATSETRSVEDLKISNQA